jgi:hypothetical protein
MKRIFCILFFVPLFTRAQSIHITAAADTICTGSTAHFTAIATGVTTPHYAWEINGATTGTDSSDFSINTLDNGDTVNCLLTNSGGDTIYAISNNIRMIVQTIPFAGFIVGPDIMCAGRADTFHASVPGGVWSSSSANTVISPDGVAIAAHSGADHIYYTVTNFCGFDIADNIVPIDEGIPLAPTFFVTLDRSISTLATAICVGQYGLINYGDGFDGIAYSLQNHFVISGSGETIKAISAGVDTIYIIATNGCGSGISIRPMEAIEPPGDLLPIAAFSTELCIGSTVLLSDSSIGTWRASNSNASVGILTGLVTGLNIGLDTIYLSVATRCGPKSASIILNVLPPGPITGADSFCNHNTITLKDTTPGGIWSASDPTIATVNSGGNVKGISDGTATITYTYGSCSTYKSITINPMPAPIIGDDSTCFGNSISLADDTHGGQWATSDPSVVAVDYNGYVDGISPGTATISYITDFGCAESKQITVTPLPEPITGDISICHAKKGELHHPLAGGTWASSDANIITIDQHSGVMYGNNKGTAVIEYTPPSECSVTIPVAVTYCYNPISVFPNPAKNETIIDADTTFYDHFRLVNMAGQVILNQRLTGNITRINTSFLLPGIYIIYIDGADIPGDNQTYYTKFVKE